MARLGEEEPALGQQAGRLRGQRQQPGQRRAGQQRPGEQPWKPTRAMRTARAEAPWTNSRVLNEPPVMPIDFCTTRAALMPVAVCVVDFRPAVVTSSQVHVRVQTSFTLDPGRSAGRLGWRVPVASIDTDRSRPVPSSSSPRTSAPF